MVLTLRQHSMESGGLDGFVDDFFVRPVNRRRGLGHALLDALFRKCRELGVLAVHVEVGSGNAPAQSLYREYGMQADERQLLTARVVAG